MNLDVLALEQKRLRGALARSLLSVAFTSSRDLPTRCGTGASAYSDSGKLVVQWAESRPRRPMAARSYALAAASSVS